MIIVTGSCRTGTSMMMQTLKLLGVPIEGEKFHADFPVEEGNPKGYYDLPFEILQKGLGDEYEGKAVKLLGEWLPYTDPVIATHMIICKRRDGGAADRSTIKLLKQEQVVETDSDIRKTLLEICAMLSPQQITQRRWANYNLIEGYLEHYTGYTIDVYFEDMIYHPEETIKEVQEFLHLDGDIQAAVDNIGISKEVDTSMM